MIVIGNGESRKGIDINELQSEKVGCNAIIRDFTVHHLVCCDKRMVVEAIKNKRISNQNIYTRSDWQNLFPNVKIVPELWYESEERIDQPWHWGSGDYAVLLASQITAHKQIHMIGFDLFSNNNKVNNIYKGTPNYNKEDSHAVDPSYWIYHLAKIFEKFDQKEYIVYSNMGDKMPESWSSLGNVRLDSLDNLKNNLENNR
tara:strand:+ start:1303 stop:1905 length:603 start_codon:yes stop_codon:yes gene_type:complete